MIFFDIDGTLFDCKQAERLATINFYKAYSNQLQISRTEFSDLWYVSCKSYFEKYLVKELTLQEYKIMHMKELFGHHLTEDEAESKYDGFVKYYRRYSTTYYDVVPCLKQLKQREFKLGIISNGDYIKEIEKLERIGIRDYFDYIITASEVGTMKPNQLIFLEACSQANINPQEAYYIGDELVADVIASKKVGMNGIWLNRNQCMMYNNITEIHSLNDLESIIR